MRMINSLTADALDSARFVAGIKAQEQEELKRAQQEMRDFTQSVGPERRPGENREQRRARERMERRAEKRAAKVRS